VKLAQLSIYVTLGSELKGMFSLVGVMRMLLINMNAVGRGWRNGKIELMLDMEDSM
jgi:hypothetical protein